MKTGFSLFHALAGGLLAFISVIISGNIAVQGQVKINEFMAENVSAVDNDGDFPDWVELYNTSGQAIDLGDRSLTDDLTLPRKFIFPPGIIIPAGGFVVVYCDSRDTSPGLHTGFGLSDKGDTIALFGPLANGGLQEDIVTFGLQAPDKSIGRIPNGTGAFTLNEPSPRAANRLVELGDPTTLKINEWSALNGPSTTNPDPDWFELYNPDARPVALTGLTLTDQVTPPANHPAITNLSYIAGKGFLRFFADDKATPADNMNFKLGSTSGDRIQLFQADRATLIDRVTFGAQTLNVSQGRLPDGSANIVFFQSNRPTPAASNFLPLTNVVINELLSHTDPPLEDAIELANLSPAAVDISNWWISNDNDDPKKFRIPSGTVLSAGGYIVFYEGINAARGFNTSGTGITPDFTFNSAHGDHAYLFSGDANGNLTGFRQSIEFGAGERGVSFGRYMLGTGEADFTAMAQRTFGMDNPTDVTQFRTGTGRANSLPRVGPVVITEIMFHPPDLIEGTNIVDNDFDEFIELSNISTDYLPLFDPANPLDTWRIRGGVDYDFPTGHWLSPGESLLVVNFDPDDAVAATAFVNKYHVPSSVLIYGPYGGKLGNGSGTIDVQKPDDPQLPPHPDAGFVPHISVDRVHYSDSAPWPATADGSGQSLQRSQPNGYGNDPANWIAAAPSAGLPMSRFRITSLRHTSNILILCFQGESGRSYSIQTAPKLAGATWSKVTDLTVSTPGDQCVTVPFAPTETARFFRVVTPAQP